MEENILKITIIATVIALYYIVSGGVLEELKSENQQQMNEATEERDIPQQQIDDLNSQLTYLQQHVNEVTEERDILQQQLDRLTKEPEQPERYVKIISPNGGESICLNDELAIEWESKGLDVLGVRILKQRVDGTSYYYIGLNEVPATYNEEGIQGKGRTVWKVESIPVGYSYKLEIKGVTPHSNIKDTSDGFFSILLCEG